MRDIPADERGRGASRTDATKIARLRKELAACHLELPPHWDPVSDLDGAMDMLMTAALNCDRRDNYEDYGDVTTADAMGAPVVMSLYDYSHPKQLSKEETEAQVLAHFETTGRTQER